MLEQINHLIISFNFMELPRSSVMQIFAYQNSFLLRSNLYFLKKGHRSIFLKIVKIVQTLTLAERIYFTHLLPNRRTDKTVKWLKKIVRRGGEHDHLFLDKIEVLCKQTYHPNILISNTKKM